MEALSFQRRRQPITSISCESNNYIRGKEPEEEEEEEEDSFFELDLTVPDLIPRIYGPLTTSGRGAATHFKDKPKGPAFVSLDAVRPKPRTEETQIDPKCNFPQSKRKILPIESSFPRPQSPISLFKSAQKSRVFTFRKPKSASAREAEKTEVIELRNRGRNFFTLPIRPKKIEAEPALTRYSNLRKKENVSWSDTPLLGDLYSKLFSKELLQKYVRFVKPLYSKVSKGKTRGVKLAGKLMPTAPPESAPLGSVKREINAKAPMGFQVVACRHFRKSKSASASVTGIMSPARKDDSLMQQEDGIESAILHCKRSFSSSGGVSALSRSTSDHKKSQHLGQQEVQAIEYRFP